MITREEVWDVVKEHLVETVEELEGVEVDPAKSMKDLGANSLDIVEVVSCSMRELKVKVPRSELNTLENINQLVDLLHKTVQEKAAG
jgi:acyl carrier protein